MTIHPLNVYIYIHILCIHIHTHIHICTYIHIYKPVFNNNIFCVQKFKKKLYFVNLRDLTPHWVR